jgi:hypothetical protein
MKRKRRVVEGIRSIHIRHVRDAGLIKPATEAVRLGTHGEFGVRIVWMAAPFGGRRAYFACPQCSGRADILYAAPDLACRRCHRLAYWTENQTSLWRKNEKLRKLKMTSGADVSRLPCIIPPKPRWKRWHTWLRLRRKIAEADHEFAAAFMRSRHGTGLFRKRL